MGEKVLMNLVSAGASCLPSSHHEQPGQGANQHINGVFNSSIFAKEREQGDQMKEHALPCNPDEFATKRREASDSNHNFQPMDTRTTYRRLKTALGDKEDEYLRLLDGYLSGELLKCEFDHFIGFLLPDDKLRLHNEFISSLLCTIVQKANSEFQYQKRENDFVKQLLNFDYSTWSQLSMPEQRQHLESLAKYAPRNGQSVGRENLAASFATSNIELNYYDRHSIRTNLQTHARYQSSCNYGRVDGIVDVESAKKFQKLGSECKVASSTYKGELSDTVEVASIFSEYCKTAGVANPELDNETAEFVYRALEHHLKGVMSAGLQMLSVVQDTGKSVRKQQFTINGKKANSSATQAKALDGMVGAQRRKTLTGALLRKAQRLKPSMFGDDSVSLDYFNL